MRSTLQVLAAIVLAATFAAPVAAATPGGATRETLTGVLQAVHVDEFEAGREHEDYFLRTNRGLTPINTVDGGTPGQSGSTVTVTGTRAGTGLIVEASTTVLRAAATSPETATVADPVAKRIAVVLLNFTNLATQPYTKTAVLGALTDGGESVKTFFEEESKGRMTVSGAVFGWYTINAVTTGCDWRTWHTLGWGAAAAAGVNLGDYTNVVFIWPNTADCGFAGLGYVPGQYTYLNGTTSVQVMTHELGHNLGLGHSNARYCEVNGTRVAIAAAANCETKTYADPFSTMGNNALRHNHGSQLGELGWLNASEKVIGQPGNTYTITSYFGPDGVKLVRIPRGDGSFFDLDVRSTYGIIDDYAVGSPAVAGVTIRVGLGTASPTGSPKGTELIDTTPSTPDLKDAPLLVGRTLTDPVSGISFRTMSVSADGVVVRVREGVAPSAPGSLTTTATTAASVRVVWTAATDNVAVGSYRITRDGIQVAAANGTATAWTDTEPVPGMTYAYTVAAVDTSGNTGPERSATVTLPISLVALPTPTPPATPGPAAGSGIPATPGSLTAQVAATSVRISWTASSDDVAVSGYRITRNGSVIATTAKLALFDAPRTPGTRYTYTVTALDAAGRASVPASLAVTTSRDTVHPTTATHFRRVARSGSYVTFAWSPASDNVRVVRYAIYRVGSTKAVASTTGSRIRIRTTAGAKYYVRAVDAAGNPSHVSTLVRGR